MFRSGDKHTCFEDSIEVTEPDQNWSGQTTYAVPNNHCARISLSQPNGMQSTEKPKNHPLASATLRAKPFRKATFSTGNARKSHEFRPPSVST
ncbi:hypothetical protein [Crateriforma spongiae]|uniref:hypothetical protein n=1 Tax=Crateriforma spongiae TaxID=2724528 RepID=UPI0039AF3464